MVLMFIFTECKFSLKNGLVLRFTGRLRANEKWRTAGGSNSFANVNYVPQCNFLPIFILGAHVIIPKNYHILKGLYIFIVSLSQKFMVCKGYAPANSGTRYRGEGGQIAMLIKFFPGLIMMRNPPTIYHKWLILDSTIYHVFLASFVGFERLIKVFGSSAISLVPNIHTRQLPASK